MAGRWQVDWGDQRCALIRHSAGDQPTLVLRTIPGSRLWDLMFMRRSWPSSLQGDTPAYTLRVLPNGPVLEGRGRGGTTSLGATIGVHGLPLQFVERFAEAQSISFGSGDHMFQVAIPQARQAIAAMRQCENDTMRRWGIDPVAFWAVSAPATGNLGEYFSDADYPQQSLRTNVSGISIVRVTVDATGRISECAPVAGTNNAVLDSTTCRILRDRATLSPARDANGNAIGSQLVTAITWRRY